MKKIALSVAALVLTAGSALAADLPARKGPPMLPPPPPPPLWTGFYVGLNAGYTWANSNTTTVTTFPLFAAGGIPEGLAALASGVGTGGSNSGFIGGGQIGYNWQFYNSFLVGAEADIQGIAGSGSSGAGLVTAGNIAGIPVISNVSGSKSLDYLGTVRGRLGWLFTPTLLVYGTGGLAYGGASTSANIFQAGTNGYVGLGTASFADTRVGWTAGGGLEWMFWPSWSAKVEYLYYDLGSVTVPAGIITGNVAPVVGPFAATQVSTRFNGNIVRAGLNYHFNWGAPAPVVAKY